MTITPKAESAAQEAMETISQTKTEAAKGDSQARLKLARAAATEVPQPPPITSKGLDATA